jgi:hypothetical protein
MISYMNFSNHIGRVIQIKSAAKENPGRGAGV